MKTRPIQKGDWTGEQLAYLRENWHRMTGSELAEELGKTRNAVLGQIHRQHLSKTPPPEPEPEPPPKPVEVRPSRPRSRGLCNKLIGYHVYCPNTAQPGRGQCAEHLPKPERTRASVFVGLKSSGASSIV